MTWDVEVQCMVCGYRRDVPSETDPQAWTCGRVCARLLPWPSLLQRMGLWMAGYTRWRRA